MPYTAEFVATMAEALVLMDKVAVFYTKYHMLEWQERCGLELRLKETHAEWALCKAFEQQHVDFVETLISELCARFETWIQDELVARKRWHRHPREELKGLISECSHTTAKMQEVMVHQSRKLSAVVAK